MRRSASLVISTLVTDDQATDPSSQALRHRSSGFVDRVKSVFSSNSQEKQRRLRRNHSLPAIHSPDLLSVDFLSVPKPGNSPTSLANAIFTHVQRTLADEKITPAQVKPESFTGDLGAFRVRLSPRLDSNGLDSPRMANDVHLVDETKNLQDKIREMIKLHEMLLADYQEPSALEDSSLASSSLEPNDKPLPIVPNIDLELPVDRSVPSDSPDASSGLRVSSDSDEAPKIPKRTWTAFRSPARTPDRRLSLTIAGTATLSPQRANTLHSPSSRKLYPTHAISPITTFVPTEDSQSFWVPAHIHPELNPEQYKAWIANQAKIDIDGFALKNPAQVRKPSVKRTKSYVERHVVVTPENVQDFIELEEKLKDFDQEEKEQVEEPQNNTTPVEAIQEEPKKDENNETEPPEVPPKSLRKSRRGLLPARRGLESGKKSLILKTRQSLKSDTGRDLKDPGDLSEALSRADDLPSPLEDVFRHRKKSWTPSDEKTFHSTDLISPASSTSSLERRLSQTSVTSVKSFEISPITRDTTDEKYPVDLTSTNSPEKIVVSPSEDFQVELPNPVQIEDEYLEEQQKILDSNSNKTESDIQSIISAQTFPRLEDSPKQKRKAWKWLTKILHPKKKDQENNESQKSLDDESTKRSSFITTYAPVIIQDEKHIYRISHTKLSNLKRPLREQVMISNLMLKILSVHADLSLGRAFLPATKKQKSSRKKLPRGPIAPARKGEPRKPGRSSVEFSKEEDTWKDQEKDTDSEERTRKSRPIMPAEPLIKLEATKPTGIESMVLPDIDVNTDFGLTQLLQPTQTITPSPTTPAPGVVSNSPAILVSPSTMPTHSSVPKPDSDDDDIPLGLLQTRPRTSFSFNS